MVNHGSMACFHSKSLLLVFFYLTLMSFLVPIFAEFQRFHHPVKADGSLSFLVIGDWGRRGWFNQSHVAFQMGHIGEKLDVDFVISTGDNFYDDGLTGVDDRAFAESFKNIYTAKSLQKPWYSVLGNHDYRGDVEAQLSSKLRKIDSRWLCMRSFILDTDIVEFFFVDTTPFIDDYFLDPGNHTYDWRGVSPRAQYIAKNLEVLTSAISGSMAKWKIVVGHHSIRSVSHHGDSKELLMQLVPLLEAHNVDFYINGHEHCLQHVSNCVNSKIHFFTSGGGSKAWRPDDNRPHRHCAVDYFHKGQGFMSVQLTSTKAKVVFYDVFGQVGHEWTTSKDLHSSM